MNLKKYLLEQVNMDAKSKLERALKIGCFANYTKFEPDGGVNAKPLEFDFAGRTVWAIPGKGKPSGKPYYILADPMVIIDVQEAEKAPQDRDPNVVVSREWVCPNLEINDEQKKYLEELKSKGWNTTMPTTKQLNDGVFLGINLTNGLSWSGTDFNQEVSAKDKRFQEVLPFVPYFTNLKTGGGKVLLFKRNTTVSSVEPEEGKDCRESIEKFYRIFTGKEPADLALVQELKRTVQSCAYQRDFTFRPDIQKKLKVFNDIGPYDTRKTNNIDYKEFRIDLPYKKESISKTINKVLNETKRKKVNIIIESKILESRLKLIIENESTFNNLSRVKKIRKGFNFLSELNKIKKLNLVSENLTDIFKQLFGKSLDSMVGNVSEPLLNSVFIKVSLPEDVKTQVLEKIKEHSNELIQNMDNCDNLSKFLSDKVSEVLSENMIQKNLFNSELVNTAIADAMKDESFKSRLAEKIKLQVCEMFDKFTTNAQDLISKLTSTEV